AAQELGERAPELLEGSPGDGGASPRRKGRMGASQVLFQHRAGRRVEGKRRARQAHGQCFRTARRDPSRHKIRQKVAENGVHGARKEMVGATGFEPATTCPPCRCATRLRYAPTERGGCKIRSRRAASQVAASFHGANQAPAVTRSLRRWSSELSSVFT